MAFDSFDFRAAMARFTTGVTVVTTTLDYRCFGLTVNAFCSVSLNPALILVSLDLRSRTYQKIHQSGVFAVNILTQEQQHLASRFASRDPQSKVFDDVPFWIGETGAPLFTEALAWVECRITNEYPSGDHILVLGEVLNLECRDEAAACEPLLYYRSSFRGFQATSVEKSQPALVL
jgi:flavin reductase (DIM6/NTAB) family NADH-FMN oxidoreductase RutF